MIKPILEAFGSSQRPGGAGRRGAAETVSGVHPDTVAGADATLPYATRLGALPGVSALAAADVSHNAVATFSSHAPPTALNLIRIQPVALGWTAGWTRRGC